MDILYETQRQCTRLLRKQYRRLCTLRMYGKKTTKTNIDNYTLPMTTLTMFGKPIFCSFYSSDVNGQILLAIKNDKIKKQIFSVWYSIIKILIHIYCAPLKLYITAFEYI